MSEQKGNLDKAAEIFERASQLQGEAREAYLEGACGGDASLRADIDSIMDAHGEQGEFLAKPTADVHATETREPQQPGERPGTTIGRYKLLQRIGEGGFGVVYMAEQQEPVRRKVALKIIKLGMDTKQVIVRFEAERQALAMMEHPNIARVFDAGATETGRPYFVMELVRGVPITEYCDTENLSTRERLELFIQVCHAVQHAHQKGIIHRDIKPSNVMVTLHDGEPVPKIIDFGIAKATNRELTDKTLFTEFHQFIGTPAYMSPEQAEMSGLDIDTRSDIYSLGVLLYELLTGTTPFDLKTLREAGYGEIQRIIREEEPPKPSTRLNTLVSELRPSEPRPSGSGPASIAEIAKHRRTDPSALSKLIRGDLDWIVMKALEKNRARRYETTNDLALDIQRHLGDEPVLAGRPGMAYKFRKFVKRNQVAVTGGSLVAAALVIGLIVSTIGFVQASRDRDRAQEAKQVADERRVQSETVTELLQSMLRSVDPHEVKGRDYTVRQLLDDFADGLEDQLPDQPEIEATIRTTIGNTYRGLGMYDKAEAHLKKAMEIRQHLFGDGHRETLASMSILAGLYQELFRLEAAEALHVRQLELSRTNLGDDHPDTLAAMHNLAFVYLQQGRRDQAERLFEETFSACNRVLGDDHPLTVIAMSDLAGLLADKEQYTEAEGYYIKALELHGRAMEHPYMKRFMSKRSNFTGTRWQTNMMDSLAHFYMKQGKHGEAEVLFVQVLNLRRRVLGEEHPDTLSSMSALAGLYGQQGRDDEAESLQAELLDIRRRVLGDEHPDTLRSMNNLAIRYWQEDRYDDAEPLLMQVLNLRRRVLGEKHPETLSSMSMLGALYMNQGRRDEAEPLVLDAYLGLRDLHGADDISTRSSLTQLIDLYEAWGKPQQAEQWRAKLPPTKGMER